MQALHLKYCHLY